MVLKNENIRNRNVLIFGNSVKKKIKVRKVLFRVKYLYFNSVLYVKII
jgi:hypothetical protein